MFYRVDTTLFFDNANIPEGIKEALLKVWSHAKVINPCQPNQECSRVMVQKCFHDEQPTKPCEVIFEKDNCPVCPE